MARGIAALLGVIALVVGLQSWVSREKGRPPPVVDDGCAGCHADVRGLEAAHAGLSCAACHLGNTRTNAEKLAHVGLVRIPGNVADMDRTCGSAGCHAELPHRLRNNIMNTMNGVVSVDRWVFGEQPTPTAKTPVASLAHSPADTHLRNLCASCHLGNPKTEYGPLDETSRGGGCLACHLKRSARRDVHPALSVKPEPIACFGCHARSGRVSLNFEGWQEFAGDAGEAPTRALKDGRVVKKGTADVHAERGLGCVDCHGSWEVMGDGTAALHREEQSTLQCTDCHLVRAPVTKGLHELEPESLKVASLEGFARPDRRFLTVQKNGVALVNTFATDGGVFLTGKYSGKTAVMKAPSEACLKQEHAALSCGACHEAWVPQCVTCHTRFDPDGGMFDLLANEEARGEWLEEGGEPRAEPATLGVRMLSDGGRRIEEFAPGMVLTLDGKFHRLFAPVFAHTVRREARTCESCHRDPLALGYGRGVLRRDARRQWTFEPRSPLRPEDGLPEDAWIGLFQTRGPESTTRENTRPFTPEEQRRVLDALP